MLANLCQRIEAGLEKTEEHGSGDTAKEETGNAAILMASIGEDEESESEKELGKDDDDEVSEAFICPTPPVCDEPEAKTFRWSCIDSGAQQTVIGFPQAKAYCSEYGGNIRETKSKQMYRLGNDLHGCIGRLAVRIPFSEKHKIDIEADVVNVDVPLLLGLDELTRMKALLDTGNGTLESKTVNWEAPLIRKHGHLYIEWPKHMLFTTSKLRRVHRHLYHTHPDKIFQLLRRADPNNVTADDLTRLESITRKCEVCQRLAGSPGRFRVAIPDTNCVFNRCVCLDLTKLDGWTVLHAVDKDTKLSSAQFLTAETTNATWDMFLEMWMNHYVGYPDILAYDQGPNSPVSSGKHLSRNTAFGNISPESKATMPSARVRGTTRTYGKYMNES